jgi:hypothetical protein
MRLLGSTLAFAIVVWTAVSAPLAQKAPAPPPKKNPLLKLVEAWPADDVMEAKRVGVDARRLFSETEPLTFTLTGDFKAVNKERNPNNKKLFPGVLTALEATGAHDIPVKIGSRGHFRLMPRNCDFVPIRVEFPREGETKGTLFEGQTSLKLGTHCRGDREYDNFTLKEYLTYRLFNLVTPLSFRARLARGMYVDSNTKKTVANRYSIFIEHENDVARRFGGRIVELERIKFDDLDAPSLNRMMLFEYMIGNTDFSIWKLHNVRIVQDRNRKLFAVPYDFDLTGFVHPPYAIPDPKLGIRSVVDRLYRGPCRTTEDFDAAAESFRAKRADMFTLLESMKDLDPLVRGEAKSYLESFFRTIERPESIKRQFVNGCKPQPLM